MIVPNFASEQTESPLSILSIDYQKITYMNGKIMRLVWTNKNQKMWMYCEEGKEARRRDEVKRQTGSPGAGRTRGFHRLWREHQGDALCINQSSGDEGFGTGAVEVGAPDFTVIDVGCASIYPVHLGGIARQVQGNIAWGGG